VNTSPSLAGQSAVAATPGTRESHVGEGVVDSVSEELIVVEVEDPSVVEELIAVEVTISPEGVEMEKSLEVVAVKVIGSEVVVATISVVLDKSVNATCDDEVVELGSHVGPGDTH
jgi:hypothetical protein